MEFFKFGYFVGSLAQDSINRRLATAMLNLAPPGSTMTETGEVTSKETSEVLHSYMREFHAFNARVKAAMAVGG